MFEYQANTITTVLTEIWRLFWQTPTPFFGLYCSDIVLGFFIIRFMIKILCFIFVPDMTGTKDKGSQNANGGYDE